MEQIIFNFLYSLLIINISNFCLRNPNVNNFSQYSKLGHKKITVVDHWPDCRSISSPSSVTLSQQLVYEPIIPYRRNLVQTMNLQGHLSQSSTCTKNSLSSLWYYKYSLHTLMSCHVKSFPVNKIYFIYRFFQFVSKL